MKGSKGVKIVGVIFIVLAILGIIYEVFVGIAGALVGAMTDTGSAGVVAGVVIILLATIIPLVGSVLQLICGVKAVKHKDEPSQMKGIIILSAIIAVLDILNIIFSAASGTAVYMIILSVISSLILPVIMIYCALLVQKSGAAAK